MNQRCRSFFILIGLCLFFLLLPAGKAMAQENSISFHILSRYDVYPEITFNYRGRTGTDHLSMRGLSWGSHILFRRKLTKQFSIKAGAGYYRQRFGKLENHRQPFGYSNTRPVDGNLDAASGSVVTEPLYSTDAYWYNNLELQLGAERVLFRSKHTSLSSGITCSKYYRFSGGYHIPGRARPTMRLREFRDNGFSVSVSATVARKIKRNDIGLELLLPVYGSWATDRAFDEDPAASRHKWLGGLGLNFYLAFPI